MDRFDEGMVNFLDQVSGKSEIKPEWYHRLASALVSAAAPYTIRLLPKFRKARVPLASVAASAAAGAMVPDLLASAINSKRRGEALRGDYVFPVQQPVDFGKTAGMIGGTAKFIGRGAKDLLRGITLPVFKKGMPASERALSISSKTLAGYGAYKVGKHIGRKSWDPNYGTALRNNILSGNINPRELSPGDMNRILEIGV